MLTATDIAYLLDPATQPMGRIPKEIFVLFGANETRTEQNRGTIKEVNKTTPHYDHGRDQVQWWGADGNFYQGVPLSTSHDPSYSQTVIGRLVGEPEVFAMGTFVQSSLPPNAEGRVFTLRRTRFSDQREAAGAIVSDWMPVANWANDHFPLATDPDDVAELRIAIAKRKFIQRAVKATIVREGHSRRWEPTLDTLRTEKNHDIPAPLYHARVVGQVFVEIGATPLAVLSERTRTLLSGMPGVADAVAVQAAVPISGIGTQKYTREELDSLSPAEQVSILRTAAGASSRSNCNVTSVQPAFAGI